MLTEGKVDGAALTLDEVLHARSTGLNLAIILIFDISAGSDMLVVRPDITELAQLKGLRIGYEPGAVGELMLDHVLQTTGLTKQDVELIKVTTDQQLTSWKSDQIDAATTYEPIVSQLMELGAIRLFDSRQLPNTIFDVLAVRTEILDYRHSNTINHLLSTHFRTLDYLNHNPLDAAYRMSTHLGLPAEKVLSAFKGLLTPDLSNNLLLLSNSDLLDSARKLSAIMVNSGLLRQEDNLSGLIRPEFLPRQLLENKP